jgi:hypothetical protein
MTEMLRILYECMNVETVLTATQQRYLDWLCTAPSERQPGTKLAMAKELDVDVKTLRRWEKKQVFLDEWRSRVDEIQGSPERTQNVLDTLYKKAVEGDTKSAQLYLQATNRMAPATVEVKSDKRISELSDSELDELISAVAAREKQTRALKVV